MPAVARLILPMLLLLGTLLSGFGAVALAAGDPIETAAGLAIAVFFLCLLFLVLLGAAGIRETRLLLAAVALISIGILIQFRIDADLARTQVIWLSIATAGAIVFAFIFRDHRVLERYKYLFGASGIILLIAPILVGEARGGARLWIDLGPISFQPAEIAKILIAIFFAAYLTDRQKQLSMGSESPLHLPRLADIGPLLLMWALSLIVLVAERDLGSSLLFFGIFVAMLYVATRRWLYPVIGTVLFASSAVLAYRLFSHLQVRIDVWLDPWSDFFGRGYQVGQSLLGIASGGIAGRGLGYGSPDLIPAASTDFPFAVIGEELGLLGAGLVIVLCLVLIQRGFTIALDTSDLFGKLLATGLTAALALQVLVIIGGVTKAIPMTGVTLPLVSYGGSSLLSNLILLTLLARIAAGPPVTRPLSRPPSARLADGGAGWAGRS